MGKGYTRLGDKKKRALLQMYETGVWTQAELAELFNCSPGRVSQLVNDVYGEKVRLCAHDKE